MLTTISVALSTGDNHIQRHIIYIHVVTKLAKMFANDHIRVNIYSWKHSLFNKFSNLIVLSPVPTRWRFGRSDGRALWPDPFAACAAAARWAMTFLHISQSVFAMCRAGSSQRKTWHMCRRVPRSRATYAKSLPTNKKQTDHCQHTLSSDVLYASTV